MSDYEIDDPHGITLDEFQQNLNAYNGEHSSEFTLKLNQDATYSLLGGDADYPYCTGTLIECAFYWEGYVSGQAEADTSLDIDASQET